MNRLRKTSRWLYLLLLLGGALVWSLPGRSQSPIAPGPLSKAHTAYDSVTDCLKCHELIGQVSQKRCLACHHHAGLKKAIAEGHGLHASFTRPCTDCHTEHQGKNHDIVDWSKLGGQKNFDHQRTGFSLTGLHRKTRCKDCHTRTTKSGARSFTGLDKDCDQCHNNPHQFDQKELRAKCTVCHTPGQRARRLKPKQIPFDHEKQTGVALVGSHGKQHCVKCHPRAKMPTRQPRTCVACHKNPHGSAFAKRNCSECHHPSRSFKRSSFAHKTTGFPLSGAHKRTDCDKCHKDSTKPPKSNCDSCHRDPHKGRFAERLCAECHTPGQLKKMRFDHGKRTAFALTGKHRKIKCKDCHLGRKAKRWKRFESTQCDDCHAHSNAHSGQFGDKPCLDCHSTGGSLRLNFDHQKQTRFALTGHHLKLAEANHCSKCHRKGQYRTGKINCLDCHKDSHGGQLGTDCQRCHSTTVRFAELQFNHDQTAFPLEGLHRQADCSQCHPKRDYSLKQKECKDCHLKDEPHQGKLGTQCQQCHRPEKGAPLFTHSTFPLTGAHPKVACGHCHRPPPPSGPPKPGWTKGVPAKQDLTFPVMGKQCNQCHSDRHTRQLGRDCQRCHNTRAFDNIRGEVHDTGDFRLEGVHDTLPCSDCHGENVDLKGLGENCQLCHWKNDPHNNGLGPNCGECHNQWHWRPARFSHMLTAFPLRGAHRTADCRSCHGFGIYQGLPTDCQDCHLKDSAKVRDPIHSAELRPCDRCHTEVSFVPSIFRHMEFPLRGKHRLVRCRNCHPAGTYPGTPNACVNCHLSLYYDARTEPDHVAEGYSTNCEDCHTPMGWSPAVTP